MSGPSRYGVIAEFPSEKREAIWEELKSKSGGVCQLCEDPIDLELDDIIIEHKDNKGPTEVQNLYIAHRQCNSLKRDLPYEEAKSMVKFRNFCASKSYNITFDSILDRYIGSKGRKPVKIVVANNSAFEKLFLD